MAVISITGSMLDRVRESYPNSAIAIFDAAFDVHGLLSALPWSGVRATLRGSLEAIALCPQSSNQRTIAGELIGRAFGIDLIRGCDIPAEILRRASIAGVSPVIAYPPRLSRLSLYWNQEIVSQCVACSVCRKDCWPECYQLSLFAVLVKHEAWLAFELDESCRRVAEQGVSQLRACSPQHLTLLEQHATFKEVVSCLQRRSKELRELSRVPKLKRLMAKCRRAVTRGDRDVLASLREEFARAANSLK